MSFCVIRGIANSSSRYVPQVVQGSSAPVRCFTNRQLPKHAKTQSTSSTFLNELNSSLKIKDDCKLLNETNSNTYILVSSVPVDDQLHTQSTYEIIEHDTHPMSRLCESNYLLTNQEENWMHFNNRANLTNWNLLSTKDETKVHFAGVAALKTKNTNEMSMKKTESQKKQNEDLIHVYETLKIDFPAFFVKSIDYKIYHPEIEFINNIKGKHTKGMYDYVKQMAWLRTVGHFKFAYVKMDVLKITMHTQDNTVRVRWRINGITGMKVLLTFWKFKVWKIKESLKSQEVWHDGFSTFYIGDDGLVFKHVAEKMMPDDNVEEAKPKSGISSKLASQLTFSSLK